MKKQRTLSFLLSFFALLLFNVYGREIKFGISESTGAAGKRFEFRESQLAKFYRECRIEAAYFPARLLFQRGITREKLDSALREFHVLNICPDGEGTGPLDAELIKTAKIVSETLQTYVQEGGGLIVQLRPSRYSNTADARYWNQVFAPFGIELDNNYGLTSSQTVRCAEKPGWRNDFFFTDNIEKHEITEGVSGLWLPVNSFNNFPACPLIRYSPEYTIPVKTGKDGGTYFCDERARSSYISGKTKFLPSQTPLPIVAIRQFGKGFVVSIAVDMIHTGMNYENPFWGNIAESKGLNGRQSDLMKLMRNAVLFAAAPALKNPQLGSYVPAEYIPVQFPESVSWDNVKFQSRAGRLVYGIVGAHTKYSDGKSTIEEYVREAKKEGLHFIVFADPADKLTPEKLEQIKAECKKFTDDDFFACPGMEFTDGSGLKRFICGERIRHPQNEVCRTARRSCPVFDGKLVQHAGYFTGTTCTFSANGFLDSADFPRNHVHPENLWWFWLSIPYVFENGKQISDNFAFGRHLLHDLRLVQPITFDRIFTAGDVKNSRNAAVMGGYSLQNIKNFFNSSFAGGYWSANDGNLFCSYGGGGVLKVNSFRFINAQEDPRRLHTRGTQRVHGFFSVESPCGIKVVRVMDRDRKPIRVFHGNGENVLEKEFELVHDKQHYLFLEAEDNEGHRLISNFTRIYDYKQGLYRCNDNMNILGPLGICWHPNWPEKISIYKYFRNAEILSVQGWDRASGDCPRPQMVSCNSLFLEGKGDVSPDNRNERNGVVMDVRLNGGDLQIVDSTMDEFVESFGNERRVSTTSPSPPGVLAENEYFSHHQRVYYLRDRQDFHIAWDHRRLRESLKDYNGSMCLVTGTIRFRKDVELSRKAAIPFLLGVTKMDPEIGAQDALWIICDREKGVFSEQIKANDRKKLSGMIAPGGFAATYWSPLGALAVFPVSEGDWRYCSRNSSTMQFGLGTPGKTYSAGEEIRYAFVSADVISDPGNPEKYEKLSGLIRGEYPCLVETGKKIETPLFLQIEADGNETVFEVGPEKQLGIDLPIKVSRLQDNGCTAIFSSKRPWFRFIGIADGEDAAYTQEPMDEKNRIWIGNVFVADHPELNLTLVTDGLSPEADAFLEVHNPTGQAIRSVITSPPHTPVFGGMSFPVCIQAGDSVRISLKKPDAEKKGCSLKCQQQK